MRTRSRIALLATLVLGALPVAGAAAATIKVTTHSDEFGSGGKCALREAIQAANNDQRFGGCSKGHGSDAIVLAGGIYKLSIEVDDSTDNTNQEGDLDVLSNMSIVGKSAQKTIVDGNSQQLDERILHETQGNLSVKGVTLRNGWSIDDSDDRGGAVWDEGGGKLTIRGARIVDNYTAYSGGGIAVTDGATLDISNSLVADNGADDYGAGITGYDGGGNLKISHTRIVGNSADDGAAVIVGDPGTLKMDHSVIANNFGVSYGGGIDLYGTGATIKSSTIANNVSMDDGGGIYDESNGGPVLIENSTISGNRAGGVGGGIYAGEPQTWTIRNSTISGNQALSDDESYGYGGAIYNDGAQIGLQSVTIANNSAYDVAGIYAAAPVTARNAVIAGNRDLGTASATEDCYASPSSVFASQGHNLIGDGSCSPAGTDLFGTSTAPLSAHLAPLAGNGGPTETHALEAGSPAINNGANCPKTDQRGHRRKGKCDIGAFER